MPRKPGNQTPQGHKKREQPEKISAGLSQPTKILLSALVALILAVLGYAYYSQIYLPGSLLKALPDVDLAGVEKQVGEEIDIRRLAVQNHPKSDTTWGRLGMILDIHGFKHESVPCYKTALELNPENFRWSYFYAIVLSDLGLPDAPAYFEMSNRLQRDYFPLYVRFGQALVKARRLDEAVRVFYQAIGFDSTSSYPYWGLAQVELAKSDFDSSLFYLDKAIKLDPENRDIRGARADVFRRLGKQEEATGELQAAQRLPAKREMPDPVYESLIAEGISTVWYRDRGLAFQAAGEVDKAIKEFRTALALRPDPDGHNHIGALLQRLGRYQEAVFEFKKAISLTPDYVVAYMNLGETFLQAKQPQEAILWFEKSTRIKPDLPDAYLKLSDVYLTLDRPGDAILTLRKGLQRTGGLFNIALRLAWVLATGPDAKLRDGSEATRLAKAACERTKYSNPAALDVLAAAYAETGQFDQAMQFARKASRLATQSERYNNLGPQIQNRLALYSKKRPYRQEKIF